MEDPTAVDPTVDGVPLPEEKPASAPHPAAVAASAQKSKSKSRRKP